MDTNLNINLTPDVINELQEEPDADRQSIMLIRHGDDMARDNLIRRYQGFVYNKTRPYFLMGADREDLAQEGMLGLVQAIKSYDLSKDVPFKTFADICITRRICTAVKTYGRQKHSPLNSSFSLNQPSYGDEDDRETIETINTGIVQDPVDTITTKETFKMVEQKLKKLLSPFEQNVYYLQLYEGLSYEQIAVRLDSHTKAVDNAIQRIRKKVSKHISIDDEKEM